MTYGDMEGDIHRRLTDAVVTTVDALVAGIRSVNEIIENGPGAIFSIANPSPKTKCGQYANNIKGLNNVIEWVGIIEDLFGAKFPTEKAKLEKEKAEVKGKSDALGCA